MLLFACCAAILAAVPLRGGRLRRLADLRLRSSGFLAASLALQTMVLAVLPHGEGWARPAAHLASYALAGVFLVRNRAVPGLLVLAAGAAMNLAAIAANGGVMPADPAAQRAAGIADRAGRFENSAVVHDARLALLGDVFAVPRPLPLANVFSVGDVVIVAGAALVVHRHCVPRRLPA